MIEEKVEEIKKEKITKEKKTNEWLERRRRLLEGEVCEEVEEGVEGGGPRARPSGLRRIPPRGARGGRGRRRRLARAAPPLATESVVAPRRGWLAAPMAR